MHYRLELIYAAWRWVRDAVLGLLPRPEPVPMPEPTDRHALFVQLAALRERRRMEAEAHRIEVDALTGQWTILQAQADEIHHQLATIQHAAFCASLDHTAAEDRLLRQIVAKRSTSLELFMLELTAEIDILNRTEDVVLPSAYPDFEIGKKVIGLETDAPSRKRRAAALHAARRRAVEMQSEPLTIAQMNTELIRLRKMIPSIENQTIFNERASIVAYN